MAISLDHKNSLKSWLDEGKTSSSDMLYPNETAILIKNVLMVS